MAILVTQKTSASGLTPSFQAASSGGDQYEPASDTILYFKNGSGSPITVTVVTTASIYGQPISNVSVTVPANGEILAGPYDPGMVAQSGSSLANLTYSGVTSLTVAVIQCPSA
jgi:hypothetical protein